jgi:hypothetical protein
MPMPTPTPTRRAAMWRMGFTSAFGATGIHEQSA